MKKYIVFSAISLASCAKQQQVHPPVGGILSQNDLDVSKNRSKSLNILERQQIEDWIGKQDKKFYSMGMNYWIDIENLEKNNKKENGESVSYQYDLYDFDMTKLYEKQKVSHNAKFGHFVELKAVEDALRYMKSGDEATLLVPSVLAFGTYGDNDQIPNDMPLIIKLKVL